MILQKEMCDKRMKPILAINPYTRCETTYINRIQAMLESEYTIVDYRDAKRGVYPIESISVIYLNWLENFMDIDDRCYLQKAKKQGTKIVWVFHNRVPHDSKDINRDIDNIQFLIDIADCICILSKGSREILKQYASNLEEKKVIYLPHQDFKGMYGYIRNPVLDKIQKNTDMVFACYGLIRPYKNIEIVIHAFREFNKNKNCKLIIAGKPSDFEYVNKLEKLVSDESILFIPEYIPSSMMGTYIECADVLVMPYDVKSSMNSGAMIMAFSYQRTVITADISMADDFDSALIYKYIYTDEEDHIRQLVTQMEKVYYDGRDQVRGKGKFLFEVLTRKNSPKLVKEKLLNIVKNENFIDQKSISDNTYINEIIEERELWKERFKLAQAYERMALAGKSVAQLLIDSSIKKVVIYGYGMYGKKLKKELEKAGIEIQYIIDKNAESIHSNVPLYKFGDVLPVTENLIITAPGVDYYEVMDKMNRNEKCQVYILKEMY